MRELILSRTVEPVAAIPVVDHERENLRLREKVAQLEADLAQVMAMMRFFQKQRFTPSSERDFADQPLLIKDGANADTTAPIEAETTEVGSHKRRKKKRPAIPPGLPREVREHDIPDAEKVCATHGVALERGADKVSEKLEMIPATVRVIEERCATYCCPLCDSVVKTAAGAPSPIPGSIASPSLLAHIAAAKYADGMPFYRQEKILARYGIELTRTTMASWMGQLVTLLTPMLNLFADVLMLGPVIYIDETHHQVLKVPGKAATSKSFQWVRVGGIATQRVVLFHFDPSKSADVAKQLLKDFKGFVTTDGYDAYNFLNQLEGVVRVQCWMHARRFFKKAQKVLGKAGKGGIADQVLAKIRALYAIEEECASMTPDDRKALRQQKSKPILDAMRPWLESALSDVPPKSVTAKGLIYALERWDDLTVYLEDGNLRMDNAPAENAIRPFAVGRNGWLFSDSVGGADACAALYSIVETAKANGREPYQYLRMLFEELPKANLLIDFEALLPWAKPQAPPS